MDTEGGEMKRRGTSNGLGAALPQGPHQEVSATSSEDFEISPTEQAQEVIQSLDVRTRKAPS